MNMRSDLAELAAFATVAEERSFTRAATRLGVSQSAVSHTVRGLEQKLGIQLLARTTCSVSPTAAGAALVRLPKLAEFAAAYPEILLDVVTSNAPVDLVAGEFDAGIQIGEFIQRDMIAIRASKDVRLIVVGSPEYFQSRKVPRTPQELKDHPCIGIRSGDTAYRWEFEKGRKALTVSALGPVVFDDTNLVIQASLNCVGLGLAFEYAVEDLIRQGRLVQVLDDWCPLFSGFFLYYPSRRNQPADLTALINTLRLSS